jgi:hypothetical protein
MCIAYTLVFHKMIKSHYQLLFNPFVSISNGLYCILSLFSCGLDKIYHEVTITCYICEIFVKLCSLSFQVLQNKMPVKEQVIYTCPISCLGVVTTEKYENVRFYFWSFGHNRYIPNCLINNQTGILWQ